MYPVTLTLSRGRCGTLFLTHCFAESFPDAGWISHEYLNQKVVQPGRYHRCYEKDRQKEILDIKELKDLIAKWEICRKKGPVVDFGWTMSELLPVLLDNGFAVQGLFIHRHPVDIAGYFTNIGNYSIYKSSEWALTPFSDGVKFSSEYRDKWGEMTPFERNLFLWLEKIFYAIEIKEKYPDLKYIEVRASELFSNENVLEDIAGFLGFDAGRIKEFSFHNEQQVWARESRPVCKEWAKYKEQASLLFFAEWLGYSMECDYVMKRVERYMLPGKTSSWIRNKLKYWQIKSWVGNLLSDLKLRKSEYKHPSRKTC